MKIRLITTLLLPLLLTSCLFPSGYKEPSAQTHPVAILKAAYFPFKPTLTQQQDSFVQSIDDVVVDEARDDKIFINLIPGSHTFRITSDRHKNFSNRIGYTDITASFKPNTHYLLKSEISEYNAKVWIENDKHERVSNIGNAELSWNKPPLPFLIMGFIR
jgi:hypothetical protein